MGGSSKERKILLLEGKKKCCSCIEVKELDNFYYNKKSNKYNSKCNECMVDYRRKIKPIKEETKLRFELHEQQLKKCPTCQIIKPYSDYGVSKNSFGGIMGLCKICKRANDKRYREDPKHRQKNLDRKKDYYEKTKHTERHLENSRRRQEKRDYKEEYRKNSSDEFKRFKSNIRGLTNEHLKKRRDWVKKDSKTVDLLGADYFTVKEFINRQFLKGMTWENHGKVWHIDHVIPLDSAGKDEDKLKRLCYYQNLSPLWSKDNLQKGFKVPDICTLWENPILPYKENDLVIVPEHNGLVGRYKLQIEVGVIYGMLTVLSEGKVRVVKTTGEERRTMTCKCECGNVKDILLNSLRLGTTTSCGCLHKKKVSEYNGKNRKLLFSNEELIELVKFTENHPKGISIPEYIIQKYENRSRAQIKNIVRQIRNKTLKRLNYLDEKINPSV